MTILKNIAVTATTLTAAALFALGGMWVGETKTLQHLAVVNQSQSTAFTSLSEWLAEETVSVNSFEYDAVLLAIALDGEARGHQSDWPHIVSALFNRVEDGRWGPTLASVLLQTRSNGTGCQVDAMCDRHMENLTTTDGHAALEYASKTLAAYYDGQFVVTHMGHSWATPAAANGHAYFEGLTAVANGTGHIYYADAPVRPQVRPTTQSCAHCAPLTSIRPKARPTTVIVPAASQAAHINDVLAMLVTQ